MPNHCENWVRIRGDEQVLQMFESQPFDLELWEPMPQELRGPHITYYTPRTPVADDEFDFAEEEVEVPSPPVPIRHAVRRVVRRAGEPHIPAAPAAPVDPAAPAAHVAHVAQQNSVDPSSWIEEHWGTRWIAPHGDHHAEIRLERKEGSLQAQFISAWSPPYSFYNRLAEKYPSVTIEYEYTEWGSCFCGYGVGRPGGLPTHYMIGDRENIRELNEMRQWNLRIWSPHYSDDEQGQPIEAA